MASMDAISKESGGSDNSKSESFGITLRNAAESLIEQRLALMPASEKAKIAEGAKGGRGKRQADTLALAPADSFKVEASLAYLQLKKRQVIQTAFSAAAATVVDALSKKAKGLTEDDSDDEDGIHNKEPIPNLPPSLADRAELGRIRENALTRSLDNKEYAKKKVVKPTTTTSSAPTTSGPISIASSSKTSSQVVPQNSRKRKVEEQVPDAAVSSSTTPAIAKEPDSSKEGSASSSKTTLRKFTRNTPASSAAALDHRFTNSRAILCAAGNIVMTALTPDLPGHEFEPNDVPQKKKETVNLGAVMVDASVYAERSIAKAENSAKRTRQRYEYRMKNALYNHKGGTFSSNNNNNNNNPNKHYMKIPSLFGWSENDDVNQATPWADYHFDQDDFVPYRPNRLALTESWRDTCLPRLQAIVGKGVGHALYHDLQHSTRHARLADFLKNPWSHKVNGAKQTSYGPHLIVTTQPDTVKFAQEFHDMRSHIRLVLDRDDVDDNELRVMLYDGTKSERRKLRKFFPEASGLSEDSFHVIVVSYTNLLEDYLHFCQMAFDIVILDDGASWMAASHGDPNSSLATVWDKGIWSGHQHVGLAGTFGATASKWDFLADEIGEEAMKDACMGLTARHRIMTASHMTSEQRSSVELLPVSGLISFLEPDFAAVVQEEWDRSNISKDTESMQHFRKLAARSMVLHTDDFEERDIFEAALAALEGKLGAAEDFDGPSVPTFINDEDFVSSEKATHSRRSCLNWLGVSSADWLRYELAISEFRPILEAMKVSSKHGHFCEEITTASSTTSSGVNGQVAGTMAYRLAICCERHFGSEQGLRQHISAQHAPPGTWLCRVCGSDCITSQARTHHERTCGQTTGPGSDSAAGATPTVGQGGGAKSGTGKKKSQRTTTTQQGGVPAEEKDSDGSLRVPGYKGVWVNKEGKHFIKIKGKRHTDRDAAVLLFDSKTDAAKKYDEVISSGVKGEDKKKLELNFKPDGTRNLYEDATSSTASGLGGSAANVVPMLSVINIKDLPPDVKPLLRDPRQTSRTGGNSKRHVYAYRGVCRQARKGHDRWQSQISFMGVNHYLGTFDSEWDAAAIYAWAHLILYGEEATKQAQKEGEEAAAAYEQEKKDIAAGKIPPPTAKAEKKSKPKQPRKKKDPDSTQKAKPGPKPKSIKSSPKPTPKAAEDKADPPPKKKAKLKETTPSEKKIKVENKSVKDLGATLSMGASKTPVLGGRETYQCMEVRELNEMSSARIYAAKDLLYAVGDLEYTPSAAMEPLRPSFPVLSNAHTNSPLGSAMLVGLPQNMGWSLEDFVEQSVTDESLAMTAVQVLAAEYDEDGVNEKFRTVLQGSVCILGRATDRMAAHYRELVGTSALLGSGLGDIDCHIGGIPGTCSERAACIRHVGDVFQLRCLDDDDIVTLNGRALSTDSGWMTLEQNDVCSIGARVFAFLYSK